MKSFKAGIVMVVVLVMAALSFMGCPSNSAKLVSITVTPTDPVYASGAQFTATGTFSDGLILNYTSEVIWSSSDPTVATVGMTAGTAGYVTVLKEGVTTITAVEPYNNFTSSSLLTVVTPSTITITPENPVMAQGTSYQFAAIALWSEGTGSQSLMSSPTLTWYSSDPLIAMVSRGIVYAAGTGTVNISAHDTIFSSVSGTTLLKVTSTKLKSILVTSATSTIAVGDPALPFTALGTFEDLTELELTSSVNWTSSATGTVLVSNITVSKGYATAVAPGTAFIIATDPITSVTGSASVTVNP